MDENERKNHAVYAGTVWCRYVLQVSARCRAGRRVPVSVSGKRRSGNDLLPARLGPDHLLLFQDVSAERIKTLCGKAGVPCKDVQDPQFLPEAEEYLEAETGISYLYMSEL